MDKPKTAIATQSEPMALSGPIVLPGCFDGLSAMLAQQVGFDAVSM